MNEFVLSILELDTGINVAEAKDPARMVAEIVVTTVEL
jgi:hypothetical protein